MAAFLQSAKSSRAWVHLEKKDQTFVALTFTLNCLSYLQRGAKTVLHGVNFNWLAVFANEKTPRVSSLNVVSVSFDANASISDTYPYKFLVFDIALKSFLQRGLRFKVNAFKNYWLIFDKYFDHPEFRVDQIKLVWALSSPA